MTSPHPSTIIIHPSHCAVCGSVNGLVVLEGGETFSVCPACVDKRWPGLRVGSLAEGFRRPRAGSGKCPFCGTTDAEALESGLVGCPLCYEALGEKALATE